MTAPTATLLPLYGLTTRIALAVGGDGRVAGMKARRVPRPAARPGSAVR